MFMAIGSRSRVEAAPLKIGASPSLLSGLEPENLNVYFKAAARHQHSFCFLFNLSASFLGQLLQGH